MIWFDLSVLAVIAVFAFIGMKKGAAKTLLSLIALVVSFVSALILGNALSQWTYNTFFKANILSAITDAIEKNGITDLSATLADIVAAFPQYISSLFKYLGFNSEAVAETITPAIKDAPLRSAEIIEGVISPVIISLITIILVLIFFVLMMIITGCIVNALSKVFNIPVIRQINMLLGGILGLVKGAAFVLIVTMIIKTSIPMFLNQTKQETENQIAQTVLFKYFYDTDLIKTDGFYGFKPFS